MKITNAYIKYLVSNLDPSINVYMLFYYLLNSEETFDSKMERFSYLLKYLEKIGGWKTNKNDTLLVPNLFKRYHPDDFKEILSKYESNYYDYKGSIKGFLEDPMDFLMLLDMDVDMDDLTKPLEFAAFMHTYLCYINNNDDFKSYTLYSDSELSEPMDDLQIETSYEVLAFGKDKDMDSFSLECLNPLSYGLQFEYMDLRECITNEYHSYVNYDSLNMLIALSKNSNVVVIGKERISIKDRKGTLKCQLTI